MTFKYGYSVQETLERLISKAKKRDRVIITPECTFKDLEVDSLEVVHILVALEDELGIDINDADLKGIHNMGSFIEYLEQKVVEARKTQKP